MMPNTPNTPLPPPLLLAFLPSFLSARLPACTRRQLFIDSYNKRKPDNQLDVAGCHLEAGSGGSEHALGRGDTIGATIADRTDVYVRPGATEDGLGAAASAASATAAAAAAESAAKSGENLRLSYSSCVCTINHTR